MKVLTYNDQKITVLRETKFPVILIGEAVSLTTGKSIKNHNKTIKFLLTANHTSLFEHCSMTLFIENVSRSFLAQITRHRMSSFTSGSQHYQDYQDYPAVISPNLSNSQLEGVHLDCDSACASYIQELDEGIPREEARQVLPNAMAVNILWTINARSLINFLNLRMCKRNTKEMLIFAHKIHALCCNWFPELFEFVGPDCFMTKCRQGAMSCQKE